MKRHPYRRLAALAMAAGLLLVSALAAAETAPPPEKPDRDFAGSPFVYVALGETNQEEGIRLIEGQPDGVTKAVPENPGRQSQPGSATERYFYFAVHDTYVVPGQNKVTLSVAYKDSGLTPIYLEYDAYDPLRPRATADELVKKRVPLLNRTNTDSWKTHFITLEDVRFGGYQPGGADFRIFSLDSLSINMVSVRLLGHVEMPPEVRVVLDGREIPFDPNDAEPFIHPGTGRTLVPFRKVFNALGIADRDIAWYADSRSVEARRGDTLMRLTIDSDAAAVNFVPVALDQPAIIRGSRTFVPLRFVTERFGLMVGYAAQGNVRTITLTSPAPSRP